MEGQKGRVLGMNVSRKTILSKMEAEMTAAKRHVQNRELLLRHVAKVKLLCELLLEESSEQAFSAEASQPSPEEIEWMMKGRVNPSTSSEKITHDPESIFDF